MELGEKVKYLRNKKKMTIKNMSELTGLSTGFISQFERGITTIDVKHLNKIAEILETDITTFFTTEHPLQPSVEQDIIVRGYLRPYIQHVNRVVHFNLGRFNDDLTMSPEYIEIMPNETKEVPAPYTHDGEEFLYVLEGVLTLSWGDQDIKLYAGDSAHFNSYYPHNWDNMSDVVTKVIIVHAPKSTN